MLLWKITVFTNLMKNYENIEPEIWLKKTCINCIIIMKKFCSDTVRCDTMRQGQSRLWKKSMHFNTMTHYRDDSFMKSSFFALSELSSRNWSSENDKSWEKKSKKLHNLLCCTDQWKHVILFSSAEKGKDYKAHSTKYLWTSLMIK